MTGTLYGIGVGPGDPELITVKAQRLLARVPVIAWPAPPRGESMARRIAAPHITSGRIEVAIRMPIESPDDAGRRGGENAAVSAPFPDERTYARAAATLAEHLAAGRDVAALCEGDPFLYGSFMYLFARMADRFPVEVVPGVSSLMAGAARLGAPLAARDDVLTVIPAPLPSAAIADHLTRSDAAAILKLGRHLPRVRRLLNDLGLVERTRYIAHATMAEERGMPLSALPDDAQAPYFSMLLVHRRGLAWSNAP